MILLFTSDRNFEQLLAEPLLAAGAKVAIARSVAEALLIVCERGRELDLAVMDFEDGCRGMTLLSAVHGCFERLPVLVTMPAETDHVQRIAYANGASACLHKSLDAPQLIETIRTLTTSSCQLIAA